jgi:hypothetical protein
VLPNQRFSAGDVCRDEYPHTMSRPACVPQRLSSRRLAAWLSLFAVLLIYLGPLVAQTRALQIIPAEPTAQAEHGAAHASAHTPEHLSAQGSGHPELVSEYPPEHPAEHSAHHGADSLGDACGYCSLLLNSPALGNSGFMLGAAPLVDHTPRRAQPRAAARVRSAFADAQPRAPPNFS